MHSFTQMHNTKHDIRFRRVVAKSTTPSLRDTLWKTRLVQSVFYHWFNNAEKNTSRWVHAQSAHPKAIHNQSSLLQDVVVLMRFEMSSLLITVSTRFGKSDPVLWRGCDRALEGYSDHSPFARTGSATVTKER